MVALATRPCRRRAAAGACFRFKIYRVTKYPGTNGKALDDDSAIALKSSRLEPPSLVLFGRAAHPQALTSTLWI